MSYAICFNLDQPKILSSGNGLRKKRGYCASAKSPDPGEARAVRESRPDFFIVAFVEDN